MNKHIKINDDLPDKPLIDAPVDNVNCKWISWFQPTDDHRPLTFPPNKHILGWWCTGTRGVDAASTMVAMVNVKSDSEAKDAIKVDWPEANEWRFCETKFNLALSDRFPLDGWAKERFENLTEQTNEQRQLLPTTKPVC